MRLLQCIPNFSEGKDPEKIASIVKTITDVPGVFLLDQDSDPAHHRSVITFAGEPEAVVEAAFLGCKAAAELIDLRSHRGEHPRMGATDVIPFVPLTGISIEETVTLAHQLGRRIGEELKIPVYLYEQSATHPSRKNLADIRKGEFEVIKEEIGKVPHRDPDYGPKKIGPAGATAVGVRAPLIAFNVNLKTNDLSIAKSIAKKIREKDGGFPSVKALGFELSDRNQVQVSMNMTDYNMTNLNTVFEAIQKEAAKSQVEVVESEIVGLVPEDALIKIVKSYLHLHGFHPGQQILEKVLQKKMEKKRPTLHSFLDDLASSSPTPGGGSAAALSGALAASLISMVAELTLKSKRFEKVHAEMKKIINKTETLRCILSALIDEDAKAYSGVRNAYRAKKPDAIEAALQYATDVPLRTAKTTLKLIRLLKILEKKGNPNAASDVGVAKLLIDAGVKGALLNVEINLKSIKNKKFYTVTKASCKKITKLLL